MDRFLIGCISAQIFAVQYLGEGDYVQIPRVEWGCGMGHKQIRGGLMPGGRLRMEKLASLVIEECETSLSTNDIMGLGLWAVFTSPEFVQLSLPNDNVPGTGKIIGGAWCYVYDLEKARKEIKDFIFEENYYSAEEVSKREND